MLMGFNSVNLKNDIYTSGLNISFIKYSKENSDFNCSKGISLSNNELITYARTGNTINAPMLIKIR